MWNEILTFLGVPVARSVLGWLENSLKDGEISSYEWCQLASTIIRIGTVSVAAFYGLNSFAGFEVSTLGASAGAVVFDFLISKMKIK